MKSNTVRMRMPSRWADGLWKEALPIGNGKTGALLFGCAGMETFAVNRYDRWECGGRDTEIPDVHETLGEMRALQRQGKAEAANNVLSKALSDKGYASRVATPKAPARVRFIFDSEYPFSDYERGIDLMSGEAYVRFTQNGFKQCRRAFVSRAYDQAVLDVASETSMNVKVITDDADGLNVRIKAYSGSVKEHEKYTAIENCSHFTVYCAFGSEPETADYDALFASHAPLHRAAMGNAELNISDTDTYNEVLLDEAFCGNDSNEIYDKLWHIGRYVFVCGTAEGGNPFPLYGLWNGTANACWAQNVANENVKMMYWHAPAGGFAALIKPLIHYYYSMIDECRDAARKLFGTKGIFVSVYSTPITHKPAPNVPVIVNYISCAGWLSRHFYDYYLYTGDRELMESEILPFMLETAAFYEDYVQTDENGMIRLSPSVSPENTPSNLMPDLAEKPMGHPNPVVWNSTMDFAIMKEHLSRLLEIKDEFGLSEDSCAKWRDILSRIPKYMVNEDGAVKEWMDESLKDNYSHRHLSHIYPLFPGDEISTRSELFCAFERAVDLRKLGSQSGWSLAHMAAIYCRMGRGNRAKDCLRTLSRSCLLANFFTQHNDWRNMGLTLSVDHDGTQLQLDALMGCVNAIQEMLMRFGRGHLELLPALPADFESGSFSVWSIPGGKVSCKWDKESVSAEIYAEKDMQLLVSVKGGAETPLRLSRGEKYFLT